MTIFRRKNGQNLLKPSEISDQNRPFWPKWPKSQIFLEKKGKISENRKFQKTETSLKEKNFRRKFFKKKIRKIKKLKILN